MQVLNEKINTFVHLDATWLTNFVDTRQTMMLMRLCCKQTTMGGTQIMLQH